MPAYRILGACNPKMALDAVWMEPRVAAMLPCNVILHGVTGGVKVSAIDPVASMQAIDNAALHRVAGQGRDLLAKAVAGICSGGRRQPALRRQELKNSILIPKAPASATMRRQPRKENAMPTSVTQDGHAPADPDMPQNEAGSAPGIG